MDEGVHGVGLGWGLGCALDDEFHGGHGAGYFFFGFGGWGVGFEFGEVVFEGSCEF